MTSSILAIATLAACGPAPGGAAPDERAEAARARMVREQIQGRGVRDPRVLDALGRVPRHEFVPASQRPHAYRDSALPIGSGQTISQPYVVAAMSEAVALQGHERVLDVGTGSGYQAAVLALLAREVYSIEILPELAERARADLARLGFHNVEVRQGDGYAGWPERAPFDAIVVAAAPEEVPPALIEQLAPGGRLVIPVGPSGDLQQLLLLRRTPEGIERRTLFPVRFVPLVRGSEGDEAAP